MIEDRVWERVLHEICSRLSSGSCGLLDRVHRSTGDQRQAFQKTFGSVGAQLGYDLQYRVYTPPRCRRLVKPAHPLSDGWPKLSSRRGHGAVYLNQEIAAGRVKPLIAVFVDPRDPDYLKNNRRNSQFFCNLNNIKFYVGELVPHITSQYHGELLRKGQGNYGPVVLGAERRLLWPYLRQPPSAKLACSHPPSTLCQNCRWLYETEDVRPDPHLL